MLVISDASPINVLVRIKLTHILPELYGRVLIPPAVADELNDPRAPQDVRDFMGKATIKPVAKILLSRDGLLAFYALLTGYMKDKKLIE